MARKYNMTNRSDSSKKTNYSIITATENLLASGPLDKVTLPAIAKGANVTVQTVMRHMGSREGCLKAVAKMVAQRIDSQRGHVKSGDIDSAISVLMEHYESDSTLILNLLDQANKGENFASKMAEKGRKYHRNWVVHCFNPLADLNQQETLDALVAATDIYVYKLLRHDLGRSFRKTKSIINHLVRGILEDKL